MAELRSSDVLSKITDTQPRMCELNIHVEETTLTSEVDISINTWTKELANSTGGGGGIFDYVSTVTIPCSFKYIIGVEIEWTNYNASKTPQLNKWEWKEQEKELVVKFNINDANSVDEPGECNGILKIVHKKYRYSNKEFMPYSLRQAHKQWALYNIHGQIGSSMFLYPYGKTVDSWMQLNVPANLIGYYCILDLTKEDRFWIQLTGDNGTLSCRIDNKTNKYTIEETDIDETQLANKTIKIKFFLMPYEVW